MRCWFLLAFSQRTNLGRVRYCRDWIEHFLEIEIDVALDLNDVAGTSVYVGAKNLMAYAQLCLVAEEIGRWAETYRRLVCDGQ